MSRSKPTVSLDVKIGERTLLLSGRIAWALQNLIDRGDRGVTPIDTPGPRWSHYVFMLRGYGLDIETIHEPHGGPFSGTHARYVLRTPVTVIKGRIFGEAA